MLKGNVMNTRPTETAQTALSFSSEVLKKEFDGLWRDDQDLKTNIQNVISAEQPLKPTKRTGFFDPKQEEAKLTNAKIKTGLLHELANERLTLEACYRHFYATTCDKSDWNKPSNGLARQIAYVVQRMEEEEPSLKDFRSEVEEGISFNINF